ncbi:MAG TPA: hypothetical protein VHX68_10640 [Planctomycetaceae bacterium]|nr:hypothetical protein [Planctomycetaceae bacterium]
MHEYNSAIGLPFVAGRGDRLKRPGPVDAVPSRRMPPEITIDAPAKR